MFWRAEDRRFLYSRTPSSDHTILCFVLGMLGGFSAWVEFGIPVYGRMNLETIMSCLESTLGSSLEQIISSIFSDIILVECMLVEDDINCRVRGSVPCEVVVSFVVCRDSFEAHSFTEILKKCVSGVGQPDWNGGIGVTSNDDYWIIIFFSNFIKSILKFGQIRDIVGIASSCRKIDVDVGCGRKTRTI